jgi:hypothetical protein
MFKERIKNYATFLNNPRNYYCSVHIIKSVVSWLGQLVAGLPPRRAGFAPGSVHVGFVVDIVALGQVFPRVLQFFHATFIPPVFHYFEKDKK